MADPNTPEFQINTPGSQQPQEPTINSSLEQSASRFATASEKSLQTIKEIHEVMKRMPSSVSEVSKKMENLGFELEDAVKFADDAADALKLVAKVGVTLRRGIINTKNLNDAVHAAEELAQAQKLIQDRARSGTKEYALAAKSQKALLAYAQKYKDYAGDATEALKEFSKVMHENVGDADKLAKNLKAVSLNHLTRQIHGVSKAMKAAGIDPFGLGSKMDKYAAGTEAKKRIKEITEARKSGNVDAARKKQAQAIEWAKTKFPDMDVASPDFRAKVATRMGMRKAHIAKYTAGGPDAEGMFEHGGGGIMKQGASMLAGLTEGGIGGVAGLVGEFAPVLAVIEALREMFDKFVKQNQDMEKSLGKAGLFAGGAGGFTTARAALNPQDAFSKLGFSFDRNLKMAQAMSEAGMAPTELATGGGTQRANNVRGSGAEGFGQGGFGQMQRIAMTTGRLAGLTDTESITETVKLLQQYRETMESSDDFFIKVSKSASAAGLTTTKYIGIIDDVNSHFNAMNKNLNQTLAVLTEMGKTGRMGSEDLKAYMDFLTTGGPPKSMSDVANNAFTMMNMSPGQLAGIKSGARLDVKRAAQQAKDAGLGPISPEDMMGAGAQGKIQQLDLLLANNTTMSPDQKQNAMAALKALKQSANRYSRISQGGGAIGQGFGQLFGESPEELAQMNQTKLEIAIRKSGGNMQDFMSHPGAAGGKFQAMTGILQLMGLTPEKAMQAFEGRGAMATNMLQDFQQIGGETDTDIRDDKRQSAIAFLKEFKRADKSGALKIGLNDKTIAKLSDPTQTSADDLGKYFKENGDLFSTMAAGMNTTGEYIQKGFHFDRKVEDKDRSAAIAEAKKVGMQTQTTGDIIANAFSKWFTQIIGLLEKIASSRLLGGSQKDPEATSKIYRDNSIASDKAQTVLQKSMDSHLADMKMAEAKGDTVAYQQAEKEYQQGAATLDKLKEHSEYLSDAKEWLKIIAENAPATMDDVTRSLAMQRDSGTAISQLSDEQQKNMAMEVYKALQSVGGVGDASGDIALDDAAWQKLQSKPQYMDALKNLQTQGVLTGGQPNAQGQSVFHITNNFGAKFQQSPPAQSLTSTPDRVVGSGGKKSDN